MRDARFALPMITTSRLLKSCAIPPARMPRLSSRCVCRSFSSVRFWPVTSIPIPTSRDGLPASSRYPRPRTSIQRVSVGAMRIAKLGFEQSLILPAAGEDLPHGLSIVAMNQGEERLPRSHWTIGEKGRRSAPARPTIRTGRPAAHWSRCPPWSLPAPAAGVLHSPVERAPHPGAR